MESGALNAAEDENLARADEWKAMVPGALE